MYKLGTIPRRSELTSNFLKKPNSMNHMSMNFQPLDSATPFLETSKPSCWGPRSTSLQIAASWGEVLLDVFFCYPIKQHWIIWYIVSFQERPVHFLLWFFLFSIWWRLVRQYSWRRFAPAEAAFDLAFCILAWTSVERFLVKLKSGFVLFSGSIWHLIFQSKDPDLFLHLFSMFGHIWDQFCLRVQSTRL